MIFVSPTSVDQTTPPTLLVMMATGFYILLRDPSWHYPAFAQWDIEYSSSSDNVSYSPWIYNSSPPNTTYSYSLINNIDITKYYKFRYKCRSRLEVSAYSAATVGAKPLLAVTSGQTHTAAAASYGFGTYN